MFDEYKVSLLGDEKAKGGDGYVIVGNELVRMVNFVTVFYYNLRKCG